MKLLLIAKKHIRDNLFIYIGLVLSLMIGISSGALTINMLNDTQKNEIIKFIDSFLKIINENDIDNILIIKQSFFNNFKTLVLIWFLGITIIGIPLIIAVVLLRGFVVGFTVGFLVKELGIKGLVFSILSLLPQNIFLIPWIIVSCAIALNFSILIIKSKFNKGVKFSYTSELIKYSMIMGTLFLTSIIGMLIESYITPILMKAIS